MQIRQQGVITAIWLQCSVYIIWGFICFFSISTPANKWITVPPVMVKLCILSATWLEASVSLENVLKTYDRG